MLTRRQTLGMYCLINLREWQRGLGEKITVRNLDFCVFLAHIHQRRRGQAPPPCCSNKSDLSFHNHPRVPGGPLSCDFKSELVRGLEARQVTTGAKPNFFCHTRLLFTSCQIWRCFLPTFCPKATLTLDRFGQVPSVARSRRRLPGRFPAEKLHMHRPSRPRSHDLGGQSSGFGGSSGAASTRGRG